MKWLSTGYQMLNRKANSTAPKPRWRLVLEAVWGAFWTLVGLILIPVGLVDRSGACIVWIGTQLAMYGGMHLAKGPFKLALVKLGALVMGLPLFLFRDYFGPKWEPVMVVAGVIWALIWSIANFNPFATPERRKEYWSTEV